MGKPWFLRHLLAGRGTRSGGAWRAGLPLANMLTPDIREVSRSVTAAHADTQWREDYGTAVPRWFDTFALRATNLTADAKLRFVLTDSATDAGARVLDSGLLDVPPQTVWGADPWGSFAFSGLSTADDDPPPQLIVWRASAPATARYRFTYIQDAANPAGYVEVGRDLCGPSFTPDIGFDFGAAWEHVDPSDINRTPYGLLTWEDRPTYRRFLGRFGFLREDEAIGFFGDWMRLGNRREVLFAQDADDPASLGQRRVLHGILSGTRRIEQPIFNRYRVDLELEEII